MTALPELKREPIRAALDAAAVLHWFDAALLVQMLEIPSEDEQHRFEILKTFSFVESYRSRDQELLNVHESTRLGWRRKIAEENPEGFRTLSARAAAYFADDANPISQIEWIYHLLCADPERGGDELEALDSKWTATAHPEHQYALAAKLGDLEQTRLVKGAVRVEVLLYIAEARNSREETSRLEKPARGTRAVPVDQTFFRRSTF